MDADTETMDKFVEKRYKDAIGYYWKASRNNKMAYKLTRSMTVILSAIVTLTASLSSADFVNTNPFWNVTTYPSLSQHHQQAPSE